MTAKINAGRRHFLKTSVGALGGLMLGVYFTDAAADEAASMAGMAGPGLAGEAGQKAALIEPHAFVRITPDNIVTVIIKHLEMGQGSHTGLATLVADELDADWGQIRTEGAPADPSKYANLTFSPMMGTGGSTSMANSFQQMRKAGAATRLMLIAAAAERWGVHPAEITVKAGVLSHPSGKQASFGELAEAAARQPVPEDATLKTPDQFIYIGKSNLRRVDANAKSTGMAHYTQDVKLPGMLTALVAHPPLFGATVKAFDAAAAKGVKGVVDVVQIPTGVAVLAQDFWSAKQGRDLLQVEWDDSKAYQGSSDLQMAQYRELAKQPGLEARKEGDADTALQQAATVLTAAYEFPYLAHAAMEPLNCVVHLHDDGCEIWNGEQFQSIDQPAVAELLGLKPEQVKINALFAGGSFGRRANPKADYVLEAANIAKAYPQRQPIKLVWTREDDMRAGYYRPAYYHEIQAGLDASGKLTAWKQRLVGQSILKGTMMEMMVKDGIDPTSTEGSGEPYSIPNLRVELHTVGDVGVPVQWWRSVGHTHTGFATECFMDELAHAAGKDPLEFRRALLQDKPRHLQVLNLAAEKAGWGEKLPEGRGRGIALVESFNSYVAEVAEVTVHADRSFSVDRVVVAVDCGVPVNPDVIYAQMGGGVGFGLSAALGEKVTLKNGKVEQANFDTYPVLRMPQMPSVEVHIVPSNEDPTGVGEPGVPPLAPAVANALFAATGKRIYQLPIGRTV
ncbi:xanthine dehydrogenase family protein molybdopterin-binding subunit [Candidatus Thiothrix sp. Deng01]|uniref:Xanthine dehydrogenase family protein molybdopterin-binding subunit n=1 Tax=Candidatus Thiothrix phosphatis TaxID=3112415 RepID=A0ABU6CSD6_9GAMM|nr:xanthine dehydrogenase family protein molybdopterin-binding subunit [Candidatus Thiothrix sp. Deng01]MEB4589442.1 xanthine dehydrogenase family protein molybdopterin-binding subunit [Candidatus Thiothrix sp. Deng01]